MPPTATVSPSPRAWSVAHGLVRTRRASAPKPVEVYIWLWGAHGERYWIASAAMARTSILRRAVRGAAPAMSEPETPLDQTERHIREAEGLIARQEELIADLERHDHAEAAVRGRELLATLRRTLEVAREHRRVLLERGSADASC